MMTQSGISKAIDEFAEICREFHNAGNAHGHERAVAKVKLRDFIESKLEPVYPKHHAKELDEKLYEVTKELERMKGERHALLGALMIMSAELDEAMRD